MEKNNFKLRIPETAKNVRQGEEPFIIEYNGVEKRIRAHDYDEIYKVPGLYEYLFYDKYKCDSPNVVCSELVKEVENSPMNISDLKVLDVGAGNGMVGEELKSVGADAVFGIDIIEEAAQAIERDRPEIYEDYLIEDLTRLSNVAREKIEKWSPNCMTVVAALGFDDIPPEAFAEAYNIISETGWVAFNIKDEFCSKKDRTGFAKLINDMTDSGVFSMKSKKRYRHRFCQDGTPLNYFVLIAQKQKNIPENMLQAT
ncbi:MAG: methyltransferase [Thermodesulfobacteriota bacterium]|nr:methyltransferase [Thermodesulfobacteriota bacterium]